MADIDDLSDSEQYNDDFVVGTPSPDKNSKVGVSGNNDVDDEQHAQKVNGQMEQLKMTVKDLEEQLQSERRKHEETKKALKEEQSRNNSSPSSSSSAAKNFGVCDKVARELLSACSKLGIESSVFNSVASSTMSEEEALRIVAAIVDRKRKDETATGGNTTRPITTQSTKSNKYNSDDAMRKRIEDLEQELVLAMNAAEDIKALKAKLLTMVDRIRSEKESRDKLNSELKSTRKKLSILTDHIEKLMGHLKHEAAAKIRALENLREMEKEKLHTNQKCQKLVRKGVAKDRLILELREGGKILEDQLRLMDEKYLELRTKLDFARENSEKRIKKADKTASDLRVKFALLGHSGSLDAMPMPNQSIAGSQTFDGTGSLGSFDGDQYTADGQSYYTADSKSSKMTGKKKSKPKSAPKPKLLETEEEREEEVQRLLEKMRLKNGGAANWNEEKARDLVQSRGGHAK